ncbi:MAG TPA: anaerobic sulfatase maturase [Prolixibacteraceae bacterium]|nr:anaerobic sulfatase maturase [Prolixibacteraceae bacterium]
MALKHRPLNSVLVKPSGPDCNLGCTYCFYLEKEELFPETKTHRMSPEVQEELIRQVMQQSGNEVSIAWQGGEPALMGLDFYRRAIELEMKYGHGQTVGNGFQTNGTLLDAEWAKFFKQYDWLIGLSLDGPQHIHDRYRLDKGLHPTGQKVEEVARMLLAEGVAVNALCCITEYSSRYAEELYQYYKSLGITWMQFIPIVETDKADPTKAASFSVTDEQYGQFLCTLFDLWINDFRNDEPTTSIRHFASVFYTYAGLDSPECTMNKECAPYVVIEHNGNVYTCDFFVEARHRLGNIRHSRISDMLNSKKQDDFGKAKTALPRKCRVCPWYTKCFGGCIKDRVKDPNDHRQPRFCRSYQMFFEHADTRMKALAERWKQKQADYAEFQRTGGFYNASNDF